MGTFQRRYNRFFADIELDGKTVIAHVANTGSLKSCLHPGGQALLSPATNPERKLRFTLEALQTPWGSWVGINTSWPNQLVKQVFSDGRNTDWKEFKSYKSEHKISPQTRLDGLLQDEAGRQRFIEVKNVTLASGDCAAGQGVAHFPDSVTERGKKHLEELMKLVEQGFEAEMIFVVQRTDCAKFQPAWEIDPAYARTLLKAVASGVKVSVWPVQVNHEGFVLIVDRPLPLDLSVPEGLAEPKAAGVQSPASRAKSKKAVPVKKTLSPKTVGVAKKKSAVAKSKKKPR